jgi:hypothetical protein
MQEERTQNQHVAAFHRAGRHRSSAAKPAREPGIDQTLFMSARDHFERTIFLRAAIEMDTDGDQLLEHLHGRLNEKGSFLLGPYPQLWAGNTLGNGDAEILMDRNQPVPRNRLLEIRALHGHGIRRNQRGKPRVPAEPVREGSAPIQR